VLRSDFAFPSPADLKGKRVAVSQIGLSSDFVARYALCQIGLNPEKDVAIAESGRNSGFVVFAETAAKKKS